MGDRYLTSEEVISVAMSAVSYCNLAKTGTAQNIFVDEAEGNRLSRLNTVYGLLFPKTACKVLVRSSRV